MRPNKTQNFQSHTFHRHSLPLMDGSLLGFITRNLPLPFVTVSMQNSFTVLLPRSQTANVLTPHHLLDAYSFIKPAESRGRHNIFPQPPPALMREFNSEHRATGSNVVNLPHMSYISFFFSKGLTLYQCILFDLLLL